MSNPEIVYTTNPEINYAVPMLCDGCDCITIVHSCDGRMLECDQCHEIAYPGESLPDMPGRETVDALAKLSTADLMKVLRFVVQDRGEYVGRSGVDGWVIPDPESDDTWDITINLSDNDFVDESTED